MGDWEGLKKWLVGDGVQWTQWAQLGSIDADNARIVLTSFGITSTMATRARLRREVDAAKFEPLPIRPWWNDKTAAVREP